MLRIGGGSMSLKLYRRLKGLLSIINFQKNTDIYGIDMLKQIKKQSNNLTAV